MLRRLPLFFFSVALVITWWLCSAVVALIGLSGWGLAMWCVGSLIAIVFWAAVHGFDEGALWSDIDRGRGEP